jgi:hypothetical protein
MSTKTLTAEDAHRVQFCDTRHKPDFGGKSEAGKSKAIVSARQHQPDGQNPIAPSASRKNAAQAWLRASAALPTSEKI